VDKLKDTGASKIKNVQSQPISRYGETLRSRTEREQKAHWLWSSAGSNADWEKRIPEKCAGW